MRGLVGKRLLNRFFGGTLRRRRFNPPQVLAPKADKAEEEPHESYDSRPEKTLDKREAERTEEVSTVTISSNLPEDGRQIVCNLRDISPQKRLEVETREALEKEKELNRLKSRFCKMAAHEIRTPLTIIQTSTELLRNYRDRMSVEQQLEHFNKIETQIRRLTEMADDALTTSQADTTGIAFNPVELNMESFCQTVVDEIRSTAPSNEILFTVNGHCEQAVIDPKLMRQVLYNLLSNAVKYSPQGEVVSLELSCNQAVAIIRVTDRGIGIPEAELKYLFEAFYRASNVDTIQGIGLGLAIVKQAVEAHHGSVRVESAIGKGTTFTLTLPLALPE